MKGSPVSTHDVSAARHRARLLVAVLLAALLLVPVSAPARADLPGPTDGGRAIILSSETREVGDGIRHSTWERLDDQGRNVINLLTVDLSRTDVRYLDGGSVTGVDTISELAKQGDVDAAVNGDFFDINNSGGVAGGGIELGEPVKSPNEDHRDAAVVDTDGLGAITKLLLQGTATVEGKEPVALAGLNMTELRPGRVGVYDHRWGSYTLTRPLRDDATHKAVRVRDGKVVAVGEELSRDGVDIPEGEQVLLARGADGVAKLSHLAVGNSVDVAIGITDDVDRIAFAIGGNWATLVKDGNPLEVTDGSTDAFRDNLHPRTAIGFADGGRTMLLVTVDGRQAHSRGMSLPELGRLMAELGATEAMNLDGGGSTTMVVRDPGDEGTTVENSPSDGSERKDGNGMGVVSKGSDGVLAGVNLSLAGVATNAERIFPGAHRTVVAKGHDRGGRPVDADLTWASSDEKVLTVDDEGHVTAVAPGRADVVVTSGGVVGKLRLHVLGKLQYLTVDPTVIQLAGAGETRPVTLTGHDAQGYSAPVAPEDVAVEGADGLALKPATASTWAASATVEKAGGLATFTALGKQVQMSWLVGQETVLVSDMSEPIDQFTVNGARSTQSIERRPGEGRDGGDAVAFTVDFSQSTATRTANLRPIPDSHARRAINGTPVQLRVWLKADGEFTPMVYGVVDNDAGEMPVVYVPRIKKTTDWQQVTIKVPQGHTGPFHWTNVAFYETGADQKYKTTVLIDSVEMVVAPDAEAPEFVQRRDRAAIADAGATDDAPTRIAVMSDAQFVGRNPDSALVAGARRSLKEIVAAKPDAVYILGDFTDEAADEDFQLARRIIDEELVPSGIPWTYVPGNHEIMGAPIANFVRHFGPAQTLKNYGSTRVITLDSSPYGIRHDFAQVQMLRRELDRAATDRTVSGVVVMFHHPTRDFMPDGGSGLKDPFEAALVEDWLARFHRDSGKQIALVGAGVGAFHARQQDNVLHVTNGNSGKAATSSTDWGGFRGWTMLGIHPAGGPRVTDWMDVETRPWVDEGTLTIEAPAAVRRDEVVEVDAGFSQEGVRIPVRWPVSATWGGDGVHVGTNAMAAPEGSVASFNPETRMLTFLDGAGDEVTLTLRVADQTTSHTFRLAPKPAECTVVAHAAPRKTLHAATNVWGRADGCAGRPVEVQRRDGEGWATVGSATVGADGRFVVALDAPTRRLGTHTLRAVVGEQVSNEVTLTRVAASSSRAADRTGIGWAANAWGTTSGWATVITQVLVPGKGWQDSQRRATDGGFWAVPLTYGRTTPGTYRWRVVVRHAHGETEVLPAFTQQRVGPTIATAGRAPVGRTANAWGRVAGEPGARVWTEVQLPDGRWSRSQVGRTRPDGGYTLELTYGKHVVGTQRWRVAVQSRHLGVIRTLPRVFHRTA